MYLIAHTSSIDRWVSGIFSSRDLAVDYIDRVPPEYHPSLLEFPLDTYPVYLLEVIGLEFTLLDRDGVTAYIKSVTIQSNDDWYYGNIYYLDRDWQARKIGKDCLGSIEHIHLDNHHINLIKTHNINKCFCK